MQAFKLRLILRLKKNNLNLNSKDVCNFDKTPTDIIAEAQVFPRNQGFPLPGKVEMASELPLLRWPLAITLCHH